MSSGATETHPPPPPQNTTDVYESSPLLSSSSRTAQEEQEQEDTHHRHPEEEEDDEEETPAQIRIMSALIFLGAFYGGTAVMLGAFGAHGLKKTINDPQRLQNWNTAAQYQLIHSVATLVATRGLRNGRGAGALFVGGMTLFSGSLYLLTLDPQKYRKMGPVTPVGGLALVAGWAALAIGALAGPRVPKRGFFGRSRW
ncbi:hypothetical protein BJ166DRAFT_516576 [Pestalotiopsis sp. NC0098]|nr:hypothetical protein BJ166DRAFT_516576 [Pestalotiopsis sp. NC0098]